MLFLTRTINAVHALMEDGDARSVEEVTTALLTDNPDFDSIILDRVNGDAIDEDVFNTLITNQQIRHLLIHPAAQVSAMEEMFRQAVTNMPILFDVFIPCCNMTESEAETILSILQTFRPTLTQLIIYLEGMTDGMARSLVEYLRQPSSVHILGLSWASLQGGDAVHVPRDVLTTICEGITASMSLRSILMLDLLPDGDMEFVAESIVGASIASPSVAEITADLQFQPFVIQIRKALMCTEAIQSFDLCFRELEDGGGRITFFLNRNAQWRQLLGDDDVPLHWWSSILADTKDWNREDSHSPLDLLYFFVKEKNDVLLQNVRGR